MLDYFRAGHEGRIVKFWRSDVHETIASDIYYLSDLGNQLDSSMNDFRSISSFDEQDLVYYQIDFLRMLSLATSVHQDYQFSFLYSGTNHPDYDRIQSRVKTLLSRIGKELKLKRSA